MVIFFFAGNVSGQSHGHAFVDRLTTSNLGNSFYEEYEAAYVIANHEWRGCDFSGWWITHPRLLLLPQYNQGSTVLGGQEKLCLEIPRNTQEIYPYRQWDFLYITFIPEINSQPFFHMLQSMKN